jgi:hypothetical protein
MGKSSFVGPLDIHKYEAFAFLAKKSEAAGVILKEVPRTIFQTSMVILSFHP